MLCAVTHSSSKLSYRNHAGCRSQRTWEHNSVSKDNQKRDPLTGTMGAHPLGTAAGATSGAIARTAAGIAVGGVIGIAVGAAAGREAYIRAFARAGKAAFLTTAAPSH